VLMRKSARVAAFALAMFATVSLSISLTFAAAAAQELVLTTHRLSMVKGALRLTPAQEPYWRALEAMVRGIASQQAFQEGTARRVAPRAVTLNDAARQQIAAAAGPLIANLDDNQKRDGSTALRALGVALPF
jgi:hypothetical protein